LLFSFFKSEKPTPLGIVGGLALELTITAKDVKEVINYGT
jgi:hypothetical protein